MRARLLSWKRTAGWRADGDAPGSPQLVFYFGERTDLNPAYSDLHAMFPDAHLVGCSTGGQIRRDEVFDDEVAAVALDFDSTTVRLACAEAPSSQHSHAAGEAIGTALAARDLAGIFVLSDGLNVNGSDLVAGIASIVGDGVPLTGGMAGDGPHFRATLVGADCAPRDRLVAGIGFYGSTIRMGYGSAGGWDQFGPRRRVTRSVGNVLYELDGEPALDLYERYLGEEDSQGLPSTALLFPLRVFDPTRADRDYVRTILAVDREARSMTFAGDVPQGWVAQLMRGNFDRLATGAGEAGRLARFPPDGHVGDQLALLVSCIGRRLLMGQSVVDEVEAAGAALGDAFTRVGFYSYGEISPHRATGIGQLHNQTMTIMTLREAPETAVA